MLISIISRSGFKLHYYWLRVNNILLDLYLPTLMYGARAQTKETEGTGHVPHKIRAVKIDDCNVIPT